MSQAAPKYSNVTLAEVAQEAGVSPSTVSRIINGSSPVSPAKEARVRAAILKLGYRPNAFARSLVTGSSKTIGVLTQDMSSPYFSDALLGVELGLRGSGYSPLFTSGHWKADEEERAVDILLRHHVDGLVLLAGQLSDEVIVRLAGQMPVAVLGRQLDLTPYGGVSLSLDNRKAAFDLTTHLLERGHRCIGFMMGPPEQPDAQQRLAGYRDALEARELPFIESMVVYGDFREASGITGTQLLLARHTNVTALFCANDQMAIGARLALHRMGIRVPEEISLVGFDDLPSVSYMTPPLTTVRQPLTALGEWMARFVVARLTGGTIEPPTAHLELRLRESVASR